MAAYTPKNVQSRRKKRGGVQTLLGRIVRLLPRRGRLGTPHPQAVVTGGQKKARGGRSFNHLVLHTFMLLGVAGMVWGLYHLLAASDIFRLSEMRVHGNHLTNRQQILELAGIEQGVSLLKFDSGAAEEKIIDHPLIDYANIKKMWPSGIMVTVVEHRPLALVNMEDEKGRRLFYIDSLGKIYSPVQGGQDLDFPVITGHAGGGEDIQQQRFVEGSLAASAFNLLKLAAQGNAILPVHAISEVHVDREDGLIVYLVDQPFPIFFGKDRLRVKYFRLVKILEQLYRKEQVEEIKEIRMDYTENKVLVAKVEADG